ncbi:MAG: discoidin domain-containing protein [Bacteroidales bacterium]|jgi:hypothetical protein|nr:discoidin domain-containing protein [Bacteroidales bacterium]
MKKIIYLFIAFSIGYLSSCKEMTDIYEEHVVIGGLKYPQKVDSLKIYAGYNKLRLSWLKAKDPSVVRAEVYWNNYADTMGIDLSRMQGEIIMVDIDDLGEGSYTFYVKTFDKEDNASIPSEVTGTSYGDYYIMGATDRTINNIVSRDNNLEWFIEWGVKTPDLVYSEIRYVTTSDQIKTIRVQPEQSILSCPDIKTGEPVECRSVFLPSKGIDSVPREWIRNDLSFIYNYPRTGWTAVAKNGNHDWGDGGGGQPALLFDGNRATGWHSKVGTPFPQCVVVDMKKSLLVDSVIIYPPERTNWRYLKDVEIYLTDDPIDPDDPNLTTILSSMTPVAQGQYDGTDIFTMYLSIQASGRYMTVVFPNGTAAYISFMELEVFGP